MNKEYIWYFKEFFLVSSRKFDKIAAGWGWLICLNWTSEMMSKTLLLAVKKIGPKRMSWVIKLEADTHCNLPPSIIITFASTSRILFLTPGLMEKHKL